MSKYFSIGETADILGVTIQTLRNWHKNGTFIPAYISDGGHRQYSLEQINSKRGIVTGIRDTRKIVGYCRVSSNKQKDALEKQIELVENYLKENYIEYEIITDIGSGVNYEKKGLKRLIEMLYNREVAVILVAYPDRLVRFGLEIIEQLAELADCALYTLHQDEELSEEHELVDDILHIITELNTKITKRRAWKNSQNDKGGD